MITDPWRTQYSEKRETWILMRGPETVYNDDREMCEWNTEAEAKKWAEANLAGRFEWSDISSRGN